ncbi:hypothetical protein VMCG_09505 [Cytospora schulzeri]|uniref:Protein kinase domain-containing protein n=1 Tax=Cytospora schulzeri TaxID=448051 RepID=A0A423VFR6_9PEZI|nr:hypothetical protein VMCG_09505 [Valsa malicola]
MSLHSESDVQGHSASIRIQEGQRLSLDLLLKNALHQCAYKENLTFLPNDELDKVMVSEHVEDYLRNSEEEVLRTNCSQITEYVRGTSRRIFAILLIIEEPARIMDVIDGSIDDTDLPFHRVDSDGNECLLAKKSGGRLIPIQEFRAWPYTMRYAFFQNQWRVQAPVFLKAGQGLDSHPVHRLENDVVFPWTEYEREYDGNSEVARIKIHKAHCQFGAPCENRSFALKSLKPLNNWKVQTDAGFRLEVKALLKVKPRSHLEVDLLTTFEHQERYHLLFRWADGGNLDELWRQQHPRPAFTYKWVCWLAQQCQGLAYGLEGVHNTNMTAEDAGAFSSLGTPPTSAHIVGSGPSVEDNDGKDYGRHGDIKPQNILWFKQDDNSFDLGNLKLSDFGLTDFHRALTTKVDPKGVRATPTYSAPERETDEKLSRPFDIWSLGCIFLEFVTWLLRSVEGLDEFTSERSRDGGSRDPRFSLDNFYRIIREQEQTRAEVKPSVLLQARFYIPESRFEGSTEPTPVNASYDVDTFDEKREVTYFPSVDELGGLEDAGSRIHRKLLELEEEYDEKIRTCATVIDGMNLAAQLEWNKIGRQDTKTNLTISKSNLVIAEATKRDGQRMRSIAVLTMIFLPATFVATVFSMTFFNWSPEQDHDTEKQ